MKSNLRTFVFLPVCLLSLALLAGGAVFFFWIPLPLDWVVNQEASPALFDRKGQLFHMRLSGTSEWSLPVPLAEMGRWLPRVAVAVEDKRFYSHPGVDPLALARALWQNAVSHRVVSGASTITSQLIRLSVTERGASGPRRRSLAVKAREFVQALKLERVMGKDAILEAYLNRAPFGGNIRGVQAASLIYFGKPAARISPGEACLLVGMLKGPSLYRPDRRPDAARRRRDFIIRFLEERGVFSREEARAALLEDLPSRWIQPPLRAFHFAEMVLDREIPDRAAGARSSETGRVETTLDLEAQAKLEAILGRAAAAMPDAVTAAAGVVDNETGSLIAWVGNARFGKGGPNSWVDCGRALRSPGSALKPFAYLAAFEKGVLAPGSLLADSPLAFSGRAPRNFDLTYRGAVSARVALYDSLNAPAVRVLRMAGAENVLRLMRDFGLANLSEPASHYGDSLILGGCEVSILQMLEACAVLGSEGIHRRIALMKSDAERNRREGGVRLVSAAAVWMVSDILDNRSRLSVFARETLGGSGWHAALKTGTSYGLRDAWAAAWTPAVTVVVWAGDPAGSSWPELVGAQAAAPAALSVLRALLSGPDRPGPAWYSIPEGLVLREVCTLSGRPPTAACLSTRLDWSIEGVTQSVPCDIHVLRGGRSALLWPPELAGNRSPAAGTAPSSAALPSEVRRQPDIRFVSPVSGATYYLAPLAREQKIPLRAEGAQERIWWYLNGRFIGTSLPDETFFHSFPDGDHFLSVSDGDGRTAVTCFSVVSPGKRRDPESEEPLPLR
ncbi:MAG: penicillin-binding protein 1C [Synergistaceae bacterium]|nr:penicillin-binding protein 1C [Synergistaceae bacterium]